MSAWSRQSTPWPSSLHPMPVTSQHPGQPCKVEPKHPVMVWAGCWVGEGGEKEGEEREANSRSSSSASASSSTSSSNTDTSTPLVHLPPPALKPNVESCRVSREYTARLVNGGSRSSSSRGLLHGPLHGPPLSLFNLLLVVIMYFKCFNKNRFHSTLHEFDINKSN